MKFSKASHRPEPLMGADHWDTRFTDRMPWRNHYSKRKADMPANKFDHDGAGEYLIHFRAPNDSWHGGHWRKITIVTLCQMKVMGEPACRPKRRTASHAPL